MIFYVAGAGNKFGSGFRVADAGVSVVLELHGERRFQVLCAFELFVRLQGREGILNCKAGRAKFLDKFQRLRAKALVFHHDEDIHVGIEFRQQPAFFEQFEQDDVAHAEAQRWQVYFARTKELDEIVVTAASGGGPEFALAIKASNTTPV